MKRTTLAIGRVRMGVTGAAWPRQRAQHIARMAFRHLQELTTREGQARNRTVERLATEPVRVSAMAGDEEIARAIGAEIHRSLRKD